jgi:hypothetical protein
MIGTKPKKTESPNSVIRVNRITELPNIRLFGYSVIRVTRITEFGDSVFFRFRSDHPENWRASLKTEFS